MFARKQKLERSRMARVTLTTMVLLVSGRWVAFLSALLIVGVAAHAQTEHLRDIIGASNYGPTYTMQSWPVASPGGPRRDILNEGASELLTMGSRVIRVMLNPNPPAFYHYTANPGYTVLGTSGLMSFAPEQRITETAESDWIAREPYWGNQGFAITQARIDAMKKWVTARQQGVVAARAQYGSNSNVKIYNAVEVNHVTDAFNGVGLTMTNNAVPSLSCDLYSYTAYDIANSSGVADPKILHRNLNYLASKTNDIGHFGKRNIFLGEYAAGENSTAIKNIDVTRTGGENAKEVLRRLTETALGFGVRYALIWQVYGNDLLPGQTRGSMDQVPPPNSIYEGAWLRRPDGTYPPAYYYFQGLMSKSIRRFALRASSGYHVR